MGATIFTWPSSGGLPTGMTGSGYAGTASANFPSSAYYPVADADAGVLTTDNGIHNVASSANVGSSGRVTASVLVYSSNWSLAGQTMIGLTGSYQFQMIPSGGYGAAISNTVTMSLVGVLTGVTFPSSGLILMVATVAASGGGLSMAIRRFDTGNWLQPGGTWASGFAHALSVTDPSPAATNGTIYLSFQQNGGTSQVGSLRYMPTGTPAISPTAPTVLGGTNQTFDFSGVEGGLVGWSDTLGTVTELGVYTAPASTGSPQTDTVTVSGLGNTGQSASATVTIPPTVSGTLALTGPTSGTVGRWSTVFTLTATSLSWSDTVTLSDSSAAGTFTMLISGVWTPVTSLSLASGSSATTFRYTSVAVGTQSISITDTLGATITGSPIAYVSTAPPIPQLSIARGGGWLNTTKTSDQGALQGIGMLGQYYFDNAYASPAFQRWDNRISFLWAHSNSYPGGVALDPKYAVGPTNWSVKWQGSFKPKFSETYTFYLTSAATSVSLTVWLASGSPGSALIATTGAQSATMALTAGDTYDVTLNVIEGTGSTQQIKLEWSSASTPREPIEPITQAGVTVDPYDSVFANTVNANFYPNFYSPANPNGGDYIVYDANGWPRSDCAFPTMLQDAATMLGGTYLVKFTGKAAVTNVYGNATTFTDGMGMGGPYTTTPFGFGFDSGSNTTTLLMTIAAGPSGASEPEFLQTLRDHTAPNTISSISGDGTTVSVTMASGTQPGIIGTYYISITGTGPYDGNHLVATASGANFTYLSGATGTATPGGRVCDGFTDLYIMRPTTKAGSTPHAVGTIFNDVSIKFWSNFTVLRTLNIGAGRNIYDQWSQRSVVGNPFWCAQGFTAANSGPQTGTTAGFDLGVPFEVLIALANASGSDLHLCVPAMLSPAAVTDLANLIAFGSDGVNPYTSPQSSPVWFGLLPNLRIFFESGDENWNFNNAFAGTYSAGWVNQLCQRALYDYLVTPTPVADDLYPGGITAALADGALIAKFGGILATDPAATAFLATYTPPPVAASGQGSPAYFSNAASINGYNKYGGWIAIRLYQLAMGLKTAMGELDMLAIDPDARVRGLAMAQYYATQCDAIGNALEVMYGVNPANFYLGASGAGWYADATYNGFADVLLSNGNFASGTLMGWSGTGGTTVVPYSMTGYAGITDQNNVAVNYLASLPASATLSRTITFTGGAAQLLFFAAQTGGVGGAGTTVTLTPSNGGPAVTLLPADPVATYMGGFANYSAGSDTQMCLNRTQAFDTGTDGGGNPVPGYTYTLTLTNVSAYTVYLAAFAVQTTNGLFAEAAAGGFQDVTGYITYGLVLETNSGGGALGNGLMTLSYEGGADFHQDASYPNPGYQQLGYRDFNTQIYTTAMYANTDSRFVPYAQASLSQAIAAGSSYPVWFEDSVNPSSWAMRAPTYYDWDVPKLQAVAALQQSSQTVTYGVPLGSGGTDSRSHLNVGDGLAGVFIVPAGSYTVYVQFSRDFSHSETATVAAAVNGVRIGTASLNTNSGGLVTFAVGSLAAGQYGLQIDNISSSMANPHGITMPGGTVQFYGFAALPTHLTLTSQPTSVLSGAPFTLVAQARDAAGNPDNAYAGAVTIAISTNPAMGTLGGTLTVNAVAGVVTLGDLTLDNAGAGYVLELTSGFAPIYTSAIAVQPLNFLAFDGSADPHEQRLQSVGLLTVGGASNPNGDCTIAITFIKQAGGSGSFFYLYAVTTADSVIGSILLTDYQFIFALDGNTAEGSNTGAFAEGALIKAIAIRNGSTGSWKVARSDQQAAGTYASISGSIAPGNFTFEPILGNVMACDIARFGVWGSQWTDADVIAYYNEVDPTSIEWATNLVYIPCSSNLLEAHGIPLTVPAFTLTGPPVLIGTAQSFSVSPSSVAQNSTTTLTATGTGTLWAPGMAAFLPSAGTVASDSITTATARTFLLTAPGSGSSITLIDPSNATTFTITLTAPTGGANIGPDWGEGSPNTMWG